MKKSTNNRYDLDERLIDFAVSIIKIVESMPRTRAANHLAGQLIGSGTSPSLNYGEAQSAESRKDFIHKIKIILKELRESYNTLRIIHKSKLYKDEDLVLSAIKENNELICIFVKSQDTALENLRKEKRNSISK